MPLTTILPIGLASPGFIELLNKPADGVPSLTPRPCQLLGDRQSRLHLDFTELHFPLTNPPYLLSGDGEFWPATGGGHGYILTLLEEKGIQAVSWGGDNCRMTGITLNKWPTYLFGRGETWIT